VRREPASVLVVDDDPLFTKLVASWLETRDFQVQTASSAEAAIEILKTQALNVLITDLKMDGLGGMGLIRSLLRDDHFSASSIVVITGDSQDGEDSRWLAEQNIPILRKPFTLMSLQAVVDSVLQRL
jgi:two-component system response regulator GlrR